jgi:hypothetical protein
MQKGGMETSAFLHFRLPAQTAAKGVYNDFTGMPCKIPGLS